MSDGTVLVTGAAGFIGARVAEMLLAEGRPVVGLDNLDDAYARRLKAWRLERLSRHPAFTFRRCDVTDGAALTEALGSPRSFDAVVHLAAKTGVRHSTVDPRVYVDTNLGGTLNVLETTSPAGRWLRCDRSTSRSSTSARTDRWCCTICSGTSRT